jgi:hypothetical protein
MKDFCSILFHQRCRRSLRFVIYRKESSSVRIDEVECMWRADYTTASDGARKTRNDKPPHSLLRAAPAKEGGNVRNTRRLDRHHHFVLLASRVVVLCGARPSGCGGTERFNDRTQTSPSNPLGHLCSPVIVALTYPSRRKRTVQTVVGAGKKLPPLCQKAATTFLVSAVVAGANNTDDGRLPPTVSATSPVTRKQRTGRATRGGQSWR